MEEEFTEPEVHIIEKYFQEIMHCFTMTNIRCKGGKEIDLLAIDPKTLERYHVESRVSTTFKLRLKATYSKKGRCYKNGVDYFVRDKFNHPYVKEKIHEFFEEVPYRKILVVWNVHDYFVEHQAETEYGIEIWYMSEIISVLKRRGRVKGSRDDILRMIELMSLKEREDKEYFERQNRKKRQEWKKTKKREKELKEEMGPNGRWFTN